MLNSIRELFRYRELLYFLTLREIKVRYKQTIMGILWAVLQPLVLMGVFTVIFSIIVKVPSEGIPYPVFSYSALLPWVFFSTSLTSGSMSLVQETAL
ncbi:MAG: ABC transporter permease, partial [bacterium]